MCGWPLVAHLASAHFVESDESKGLGKHGSGEILFPTAERYGDNDEKKLRNECKGLEM